MAPLSGKVAVVTGASRGVGKGIALAIVVPPELTQPGGLS